MVANTLLLGGDLRRLDVRRFLLHHDRLGLDSSRGLVRRSSSRATPWSAFRKALPFVLVWVLVFDVPGVAGLVDPVVAVRATLLLWVLLPVATLAGLASSIVLSTSVGPPAADCAVITTREVTFCGIEFSAQTPDSVWFIFL